MTDPVTQLAKEATVMDCLARFRRLQRDLLFVRYGGDWKTHATDQSFERPMSEQDALVMEFIAIYAEYGISKSVNIDRVQSLRAIRNQMEVSKDRAVAEMVPSLDRVIFELFHEE